MTGSAGVESTLCTRISFSLPTIATRSVNVPPVSIPTSTVSLPRFFTASRRAQQNFEIERVLRGFERGDVIVEREGPVDQRARIDFACREGVERGPKSAASRAD